MNMSYKNFPFRLIGCTLFLFVGARTQSVKAILPDPSVVEAHWRKNPKIFHEAFDALFPQAEDLSLWSEEFPKWFKEQNEKLDICVGSKSLSFHTPDDLKKLSCDAELKKIIKVLGSKEFLQKVLTEEVVGAIFAHAVSGKDFKLEVVFKPCLYYDNGFFNVLGKGSLSMSIRCDHREKENQLHCDFDFDFEKKKSAAVLKNCRVTYYRPGDDSVEMEFLGKTNQLPGFPWNAAREARRKFPGMYAKLRDDLKKDPEKYKGWEICPAAKSGKDSLEDDLRVYGDPYYVSNMEELMGEIDPETRRNARLPWLYSKYKMSSVLDVLITENFLKGIFGEEFWNILEYDTSKCAKSDFHTEFKISEHKISKHDSGFEILFKLYRSYHGNRTRDAVYVARRSDLYHHGSDWKYLDSNYIEFVFLYEPLEDKISHVKLRNKLILNDELIAEGIERDVLLPVDGQDYDEPGSFEALMELHGIIKKNGTRP